MYLAKRMGMISLVLIGAVLLTACPEKETISRINADPGRYRNKEVGIAGNVTDSYGVLGNGAYEIDDGSGRIWVVPSAGFLREAPELGPRAYTGLWSRSFGTVLQETDRQKGK